MKIDQRGDGLVDAIIGILLFTIFSVGVISVSNFAHPGGLQASRSSVNDVLKLAATVAQTNQGSTIQFRSSGTSWTATLIAGRPLPTSTIGSVRKKVTQPGTLRIGTLNTPNFTVMFSEAGKINVTQWDGSSAITPPGITCDRMAQTDGDLHMFYSLDGKAADFAYPCQL